jgi:glycosyltransferase involved in cell wall biosynthesis
MSIKPRVSVCIPTYNFARFLGDAIESVRSQSMTDWELIICDNASTDETEALVRRYEDTRIRYYRYRIHVPRLENFNRCLEWVSSDYVLFLCADDILASNQLELLARELDAQPTAGLAIACQQQNIDGAGHHTGAIVRHPLGPGLVRGSDVIAAQCHQHLIVALPPQALARTEAVLDCSGFDPKSTHGGDNDLFSKICLKWDVVYVKDALFYYRFHEAMGTFEGRRRLEDIHSGHYTFSWLFRDAPALRDNRQLKRKFVQVRCYPWFQRAMNCAARGEFRSAAWILGRIASFEPVPWWIPYYLYVTARKTAASWLRRLRGPAAKKPSLLAQRTVP